MRQAEDRRFVLDKSDLIDLELLEDVSARKTRAKGLISLCRRKMFEFSFKKAFGVKTTHFNANVLSFCHCIGIQWSICSEAFLGIGRSKLKNQLGLSLFKNEIREQLGAYVDKANSLDDPFINIPLVGSVFLKYRTFVLLGFVIQVGKVLLYPIKKLFLSIRNIKNRSKVGCLVSVIFGWIDSVDTDRSLSIDDSCQVGELNRIINYFFIFNDGHLQAPCV
jgi:hypothetical protein